MSDQNIQCGLCYSASTDGSGTPKCIDNWIYDAGPTGNTIIRNPLFEVMSQDNGTTVAEQFTGQQLLQLAKNLLDDGNTSECISVLQMGIDSAAFRHEAMPMMAEVAKTSKRYDTENAVNLMRRLINESKGRDHDAGLLSLSTGLIRLAQLSATDSDKVPSILREAEGHLSKVEPTARTCYLLAIAEAALQRPVSKTAERVKDCLVLSQGAHAGGWLLLASLLSQQGECDKARAALEAGIGCGSSAWIGGLLRAQAALCTACGSFVQAQNSLKDAIAHATSSDCAAQSWAEMGRMYLANDQLQDAQGCVDALQKAGLDHTIWAAILDALVCAQSGDQAKSLSILEKSFATHPEHPQLLKAAGLLHCQDDGGTTSLLLAHRQLEKAVAAIPLDATVCHALGNTSQQLGQYEQASELQARAVRGFRNPVLIDPLSLALSEGND